MARVVRTRAPWRTWPAATARRKPLQCASRKPLGDDDVETRAHRLAGREAEQDFGAAIPQPDHAFAIGEDDRIGCLRDDGLGQAGLDPGGMS
jgi:hypothetical protein